jgi:hypothetical protein
MFIHMHSTSITDEKIDVDPLSTVAAAPIETPFLHLSCVKRFVIYEILKSFCYTMFIYQIEMTVFSVL